MAVFSRIVFVVIAWALVGGGIFVTIRARRFRKLFGILIVIGGFLFCFVSWFFATDIYQAFRLRGFSKAFAQLAHPESTVAVDKFPIDPYTGANHCIYFVWDLRQYSGEPREVIDFYYQHGDIPSRLLVGDIYITFLEDDAFGASLPIYKTVAGYSGYNSYVNSIEEAIEWGRRHSPGELRDGGYYILYFFYSGDHYFDNHCL